MATPLRLPLACLLAVQLALPASAQESPNTNQAYTYERSLIESVLGTVVKVIQEAAFQAEGEDISTRLREMADDLNPASTLAPGATTSASATSVEPEDLQELQKLLNEVYLEVQNLRREVRTRDDAELAERLATVEVTLKDAVDLTERIAAEMGTASEESRPYAEEKNRWLEPGVYGTDEDPASGVTVDTSREGEDWHDEDWNTEERDEEDERQRPIGPGMILSGADFGAIFGDYPDRWPFTEVALYRNIPAIRYNRVEGLVLGIGSAPLEWDSYRRFKVVGQVGYAFALDRWRYEVGGELQPYLGVNDFGLKLGAAYRYNTATDDLWKSNWIENTLAAFLFRNDFFDYYQVQGWSAYAVTRPSRFLQVSVAFRSEEHERLEQVADWSLFGGDFRPNPPADSGRVQSLLFAVEGGRVTRLNYLPRGVAFRAEAEIAPGAGSDFSFGRYIADGRLYLPVTAHSSFGLRLRGGVLVGDDYPFQKGFTIGGVGTVLGYPFNAFYGTSMLLGNAEYMVDSPNLFDDVFEDLQLFGTFNAGWVGSPNEDAFAIDFDDVLPSAGFGIALDERNLRLEIAWPLKDVGDGHEPSLWFRLAPTF